MEPFAIMKAIIGSFNVFSQMEEIPGQRPGTRGFLHTDGFYYHDDVRYESDRFVCGSRTNLDSCQVEMQRCLDGVYRIVRGEHWHPPPDSFRDRRTLILAIQREALRSNDPPLEVFRRVCIEYVFAAVVRCYFSNPWKTNYPETK